MKKSFVSILCALTLLCSQINIVHAAKVYDVDKVIEAEDTNLNNGMKYWSDERMKGGAVYSDAYAVSNSSQIVQEDLTFLFTIPSDGKYYIYLRGCLTSSNGSYFYRIDDGKWNSVKNTLDWGDWLEIDCSEYTKGVHKFSYNHKANGADLDEFFVTANPENVPYENAEEEEDAEEINIVDDPLPNCVHEQKYIPTIEGSGVIFEAEDAAYTSHFALLNNKQASGSKVLQVKDSNSTRPDSDEHGAFEITYIPTKTGVHNIWLRLYATASNADNQFYALADDGGFTIIGPEAEDYNKFTWLKLGTVTLEAGKKTKIRITHREKNMLMDAFAILTSSAVPEGRSGNIAAEGEKVTIISPYEKPPIVPPSEHPRVLFRKSDIPRIKENMFKPQNENLYNRWQMHMEDIPDGNSPGKYTESILSDIEAYAFDYAINGNKENGKIAVSALLNYLETADVTGSTDNVTRNGGNVIYKSAEVYDWCYDLLTNAQKAKIIEKCETYASKMEMGWPPFKQGSITSHGSEAQLLKDFLAFAIATYDEQPDIWETVAGRLYQDYVPAREYFFTSSWNFEGDNYGLYRHRWDMWSVALITGMGFEAPYKNVKEMAQVGYSQIYMRRPDGQYLRDGDTALDTSYGMWEYWAGYGPTYILDSVFNDDDPYLKDEAFAHSPTGVPYYDTSSVMSLIFNNPDVERASKENLPKSRYFPEPGGVMIARTGWDNGADSDDVVCEMKIGSDMRNGHDHLDFGHFQIYYKGILASDSGVYQGLYNDNSANGGTGYNSEHRQVYMTKAIAHNTMLVDDFSEPKGSGLERVYDGGQRVANGGSEPGSIRNYLSKIEDFDYADVDAQEIDPEHPVDPEYTYIKGDLTNAYTSKVKEYKRSFMFFNMFDSEVPGVLVVFDKVTSANSTYKKTWLLHGLEEPTVNGNQTIFARTYKSPITPSGYNGKMTVDTMLPKEDNASITVVGGEKDGYSNIKGTDYTGLPSASHTDEGNTYRMELSPKNPSETDYFLNVIQVSDNDKNYYLQPKMIENNLFYGAEIKNRAVLFSKSGEAVSSDFSVDFASGVKATVCDVKAGKWQVTTGGKDIEVIASKDGGVLAFEASGKTSFKYLGEAEPIERPEPVLGTEAYINVQFENQFVHCPVKPENINGKVMIPLTTIVKWFKLIREDRDGKTILSLNDKTAEISEGSSLITVGENTFDMGASVYTKDGELMVPARDIVETFGGSIEWERYYSLIVITLPPIDYSIPPEGYAVMVNATPDGGAVDGENVCTNAIDGNGEETSIWAANGKGRYFDIEFDKATSIDRVDILFNPNGGRTAKFDIMISDDGVNYTMLLSSTSDGSLEGVTWEYYELEKPVKTKYVRYVGNGSNISDWNAIREIRFRKG